MPKMYTELLADEFDLTVITGHVANRKTKSFVIEFDGNVKVVRIPYIPFNRKGFFWRGLTIMSFSCACLLAMGYVKKGSVIYTCGPPEVPYFAITAEFIKYFKSAQHLGLVTDMIPDVAYDIGLVKSKALRKIITQFCAWGYRRTDHILTTTKSLSKRLSEFYGVLPTGISIIETPVDVNRFKPKPISDVDALRLYSVKDRFIVLYSGSFGRMYDFDPILHAAKSIQDINKNIFFIIRGDGEQKILIQEMMDQLALNNTVLLGPVPDTEQIISFINAASVCLEPIRDSFYSDLTHTTKTLEYWACCKPVICTTRGENAELIERCCGGIAIPPKDPNKMKEAILYIYNNREIAQKMGNNGRDLVTREFSYENVRKKFIQLINKMA